MFMVLYTIARLKAKLISVIILIVMGFEIVKSPTTLKVIEEVDMLSTSSQHNSQSDH